MSERKSDTSSFEVGEPCAAVEQPGAQLPSWSDQDKGGSSERRWLPEQMYRRLRGQMGSIRRNLSHGVARRRPLACLRHWQQRRTSRVRFARFDVVRNDMVEIVIGNVVVRAGSSNR